LAASLTIDAVTSADMTPSVGSGGRVGTEVRCHRAWRLNERPEAVRVQVGLVRPEGRAATQLDGGTLLPARPTQP
jgi:hypothetical protein